MCSVLIVSSLLYLDGTMGRPRRKHQEVGGQQFFSRPASLSFDRKSWEITFKKKTLSTVTAPNRQWEIRKVVLHFESLSLTNNCSKKMNNVYVYAYVIHTNLWIFIYININVKYCSWWSLDTLACNLRCNAVNVTGLVNNCFQTFWNVIGHQAGNSCG